MRSRFGTVQVLGVAVLVTAAAAGESQRPASVSSKSPAEATARIVAAAEAVVASLDDAGRKQVQFAFDDAEQRRRWSNLPSPMFRREGIRLGDLTAPQRAAVMKLLETALSPMGYQKALDTMRGDEVLRTQGGGAGKVNFGQDQYWLSFLGKPSVTDPWMLQFGGHHLAINLTMAGSQATMAPSLPATQPATFTWEGKTVRPLGRENDKAFALINALDEKQRADAILKYAVKDLVLAPKEDGRTIQPEGMRATALSAQQQTMLWDIVREWAGIQNDAFAAVRMAELQANVKETYFAWSGPTTNGSVAYFRIQGPTLVIEYAPQGNVEHIHTIYRDPTNDYGVKFAKK